MAEALLTTTLLGNRLSTEVSCDTGVEQLSRVYSVVVLLLMVVLATSKQYLGNPVECFCPAEFSESQVRFTNSYCWVSTTYHLSSNQPVLPHSFDLSHRISYYQWLPLLFLLQASLCLLPALAWSVLLARCGLNVPLIFEISASINKALQADEREAAISKFVELFDRYTTTQRYTSSSCYTRNMKIISRHCFLFGGKPFGNFLCNCYLLYKLLCIGTCLLQVVLTDWYLGGRGFYWYGLDVLHGISERLPSTEGQHFPSVTLCELDIRQQSRVHTYVVQCVLAINVFYEKIFVLLWFWWAMVALLTALDTLKWLCALLLWRNSVSFVGKRLLFDKRMCQAMIGGFVKNYLRRDGVLLMKLISRNHGDVLVGMLLERLWGFYVPSSKRGDGRVVKKRRMAVRVETASASNSSTQLI